MTLIRLGRRDSAVERTPIALGVDTLRTSRVTLDEALRLAGRLPRSAAGITVNTDTARQLMPVWRCQHLLADIVSGLPIRQYVAPDGDTGVREEVELAPFIAEPSAYLDPHEWRYSLMLSALDRGNAYAYATEYDRRFERVARAEVLAPTDVDVRRELGALAPPDYRVGNKAVDRQRILHMRAFGPAPGSVLGMSPIDYAATTIALGISARRYGADWYKDGGHPTALLTNKQANIDDDQAETAKQRYHDAVRSDNLVVLGQQWEYTSLQTDPAKALFLESAGATGTDVCGMYGIPPELLGYASSGSSVTYANREQRMLDLLVLTVQWWTRRVDRLLSRFVPPAEFVRIDVDDLLVADALTRNQIHSTRIRSGMASVNERRRLEHERSIGEQGDRYLWPPQATTVAPGAGGGAEEGNGTS